MPNPPRVNYWTAYVLENFWPGVILCLIAGVALVIAWKRSGGDRRYRTGAAACGALAIVLIVVERAVTTSGERAAGITASLVEFAVAGDVSQASALFAPDAVISFGHPENDRRSIDTIRRALDDLRDRYAIASNHVTVLRGYTESSERGVAHLRVITRLEQAPYPIQSQWVVEVERPAGGWRIVRIIFVEFQGQTAHPGILR